MSDHEPWHAVPARRHDASPLSTAGAQVPLGKHRLAPAPDRQPTAAPDAGGVVPADPEGPWPRPVAPGTWVAPGGRGWVRAFTVWSERVPERGEDAEPFVAHHWETRQGLLAVFDGSGGAGSAPAWQSPAGSPRTGAWVGARVARLATDCWFREVALDAEQAEPESLHGYLEYFLSKAPQRRSKIGGTMRRQLPTTLAGVHYRLRDDESVELQPLWAGDSRAYTLHPRDGLQVLTRDHTRESDALELLRSDPPMTNLVCADRAFVVDAQRLAPFPLPLVLVAATDGFFGYVNTPGDFEAVLLETLQRAADEQEWADLVCREVRGYTADDASLALVALGHQSFAALRDLYAPRLVELRDRLGRNRPRALDRSPRAVEGGAHVPEDPAQLGSRVRAWQDQSWHAYRGAYETYLPASSEEHA
ncbi:serine/threonine protein phosphatase [Streptomyces sp. NPDC048361]|uniref:serine/threonine protein phosphatase n=1 Tax=Streptomyces sp. NPDC048361 TaxID=3154720 RepID=UPI00342B7C4E